MSIPSTPPRACSLDFQNLSTLTVAQLRSLSDKLGIKAKSKAKKDDLICSLLEYAKTGMSMDSSPIPQILRRPHKGPRNTPLGSPRRRTTLSARRTQAVTGMAGNDDIRPQGELLSWSPWEWSKNIILKVDARNQECTDDITSDLGKQRFDIVTGLATQANHQDAESVHRPTTPRRASLTPVAVTPTHSPLYSMPLMPHLMTPTRSPQTVLPTSRLGLQSPTVLSVNSKTPDDAYSISLGAVGAVIHLRYGEADLCEPRSLTGLITDPDILYSVWDDCSSTWAHDSPLVVRKVPVAIKYWKCFYSNFKRQNVWDSIKQTWHSFRILMEEYEGRGRDGFRSEWSRNGKLTPSHQILTALRSSGRNKSKEMVIAAKETYTGPLFDKMFSYRGRDGSVKILTSPIAISKRYLKLHPDASPPSQCRNQNRVA